MTVSVNIDVSSAVSKAINLLWEPLSGLIGVTKARFFEDFEEYFTVSFQRISLVKTLIAKNKSVPLLDLYVRTRLDVNNVTVSDQSLVQRLRSGERFIIRGNGGSGKTFFLKYLWLTLAHNPDGRLPIFVELRRIGDMSTINVSAFVRNELRAKCLEKETVFDKICETGKFCFIFDGFDELPRGKRTETEKQIIALAEKYRDCRFLVSSRQDERFSGWNNFTIADVLPFARQDTIDLIKKLEFDAEIKRKFIAMLSEEFFHEHESFLSNPLLSQMMLMSFSDNAVIPSKISAFYEQALETMLRTHDATKLYSRDRTLDQEEFRAVFSVFCLMSYLDYVFEFEEVSLRTYIQRALHFREINKSIDGVKEDMCMAVNMIQRDGLKYVFVHRSFQEYFSAFCTVRLMLGKEGDILRRLVKRRADSAFSMSYDIYPELVADKFIIPVHNEMASVGLYEDRNTRFCFIKNYEVLMELLFAKNSTDFTVNHNLDSWKRTFVSCINQLNARQNSKSGAEDRIEDYYYSIFHQLYMAFVPSGDRKKQKSNIKSIKIEFSDSDFQIKIEWLPTCKLSEETKTRLHGEIVAKIDKLSDEMEAACRASIENCNKFCSEESEKLERRGRNTIELFGV